MKWCLQCWCVDCITIFNWDWLRSKVKKTQVRYSVCMVQWTSNCGSLYQECWSHDQTKENLMLSSAWTVFVNCRFYLMRLKNRTWQFEAMTHHAHTTQCLGALHGLPWYIGVGQSTIIGTTERVDPDKRPQVLKAPGYEYMPPAVEDIKIFRIDGSCFVKLHQGTWHCAPLFKEPYMEFYNLELSNTNVSLYCHLLHLVFMILLACLIVRGSLLNPRRSHHPDVLVSEFHQYVVLLLTCVSCLAIIHSCGEGPPVWANACMDSDYM